MRLVDPRVAVVAGLVACSGSAHPAGSGKGPQRVISLVPSATEVILALGEADRLVGRTSFDHDPRIASLPSVGGTIDASTEQVVGLHPDLLVGWLTQGGEARDRYAGLGLNIRLVGTETIGEFRAAIDSLGQWLGVPERAESLLVAVDESLAVIRKTAARRKSLSVF